MDFQTQILSVLSKKSYEPLTPKALARKLAIPATQFGKFRQALRELLHQGRIELGKNQAVRARKPHGTVTGMYRRASGGHGFVRPHPIDGKPQLDILIREGDGLDAVTGDEVLVQITRKPTKTDLGPVGAVLKVLERATRQFVGVYFERDGQGYVRVDGDLFRHSVGVGDPGAKGARPDDKVVFEMLRFPTPEDRGEGVITEILGPRGQPGVDTLSVIRALGLPDKFPDDVLAEARAAAAAFREDDLDGRTDFTADLVVTIDPADARDFDDAISLTRHGAKGHWTLGVHIADVAYFAPAGGALDREARGRATSVYLPQRVLPMFPEIISNSLASLQQDKVRYVKSVLMDFTPGGQRTGVEFANAAIRVKKRFAYEQVFALLEHDPASGSPPLEVEPDIRDLLFRMRDLAMILRKRRMKRGALELEMPQAELEYDAEGRVSGAHFASNDVSHQVIEEFMLAANEAVAEQLASLDVAFLRRVHPIPEPKKLESFAGFAASLGYPMESATDRFALQKVLQKSAGKPEAHAVHYALLRSLKQAVYSPVEEGHYALASEDYCHFTSPIRRYPDLTVHRLIGQWIRTGKAGSSHSELVALGEHCSRMERRAETAERELTKLKLLTYLGDQIGLELEVVITGVAEYGFFAQPSTLPVEGLVHVSTLTDDYYFYDEPTHSLNGRRTGRRYRLGDKARAVVVRVDMQRRQLDFRLAAEPTPPPQARRSGGKRRRNSGDAEREE